jgi:hypothetical protein
MPKRELVTKNFYFDEFTYSPTAVAKKIPNDPNVEQTKNLKHLIRTIVQPIKDHFNKTVKVNSGYRSAAVNAAVGGSKTSQHMVGEAVDIEVEGVPNKDLAEWIDKNLNYDQLILEFYSPMKGVNSGWVHVSLKRTGTNRKTKLVAYKDGKSTRYELATDFSKIA